MQRKRTSGTSNHPCPLLFCLGAGWRTTRIPASPSSTRSRIVSAKGCVALLITPSLPMMRVAALSTLACVFPENANNNPPRSRPVRMRVMQHRPRRTREFHVVLRRATGPLRLISKGGRVQPCAEGLDGVRGHGVNVGHSVVSSHSPPLARPPPSACSHHTRPGQLRFVIGLAAASGD